MGRVAAIFLLALGMNASAGSDSPTAVPRAVPDGVPPRSVSGHLDEARLVLHFSATIEDRPAFAGMRLRPPEGRDVDVELRDGVSREVGRVMLMPGYLRLERWPAVEGEEPRLHGFDLPSPLPEGFRLESVTPRQREIANDHPAFGADALILMGRILSRHAESDAQSEPDALRAALGLATLRGARAQWVFTIPPGELKAGPADGNRRTILHRGGPITSTWTINDDLGGAIERYTEQHEGRDRPHIIVECGPFREVDGVWVPERVEARWLYLGDDNPRATRTVILEITPQRADRLGEMDFYTKWPEGSRIGIARRASRIVAVTREIAGRPIFFDDPPPPQ